MDIFVPHAASDAEGRDALGVEEESGKKAHAKLRKLPLASDLRIYPDFPIVTRHERQIRM